MLSILSNNIYIILSIFNDNYLVDANKISRNNYPLGKYMNVLIA